MERLFSLAIGYVFGLFQTGYIYGRLHHIDIREHGSGNAGTTNAMRTLGKKAGIITYIGDAFKTVLAAVLVHFLFGKDSGDMEFVLILYSGFGAILGHNFPFYLKFKGGKGIAASSGVIMTILPFNIVIPFIALFTFVLVTGISKYVSLGSLCLMFGLFVELVVFGQLGMINVGDAYRLEVYLIGAAMMVLAFIRHRGNIQRLLSGTERKIGQKRSE